MEYELRYKVDGKLRTAVVEANNVSEAVSVLLELVPALKNNPTLIRSCTRVTV